MTHKPQRAAQSVVSRIADSEDRRLAWEFFVLFSRFEYALKRSGFLKTNKPIAEADWERFSREMDSSFCSLNSTALSEAVEYYEMSPPRKQLQQKGILIWDDPLRYGDGEYRLTFLCRSIGVVRNNLFHGGKFTQMPVSDPSRDQVLLRHAKELLFSMLELNEPVKKNFFDGIDE